MLSVETIDGGDTLAVRLRADGGNEVVVLLPIGVVGDLLFQLADTLIGTPDVASAVAVKE